MTHLHPSSASQLRILGSILAPPPHHPNHRSGHAGCPRHQETLPDLLLGRRHPRRRRLRRLFRSLIRRSQPRSKLQQRPRHQPLSEKLISCASPYRAFMKCPARCVTRPAGRRRSPTKKRLIMRADLWGQRSLPICHPRCLIAFIRGLKSFFKESALRAASPYRGGGVG